MTLADVTHVYRFPSQPIHNHIYYYIRETVFMKYLFAIVLICAGLAKAYGQAKAPIPVPVFKEGKTIDSLIDMVLKLKQTKAFRSSVNSLIGNCMWLSVFKEKDPDSFVFQVEDFTRPAINKNINKAASQHLNYGYFQYKKVNIFVSTGNNLYGFLSETTQYQSFNFIYQLTNPKPIDPLGPHGGVWIYRYQDGRFSNYTPVVIPSKKL